MKVLEAFGSIEVQGPRQYGVRKFGVPVGGWFDSESARVANVLAGQAADSACLELCLARFTFVSDERITLAVAGAPCKVLMNDQVVGEGGLFTADADERVRIDPQSSGARVYFSAAFRDLPPAGTRVRVGDAFCVTANTGSGRQFRLAEVDRGIDSPLRIVAGPQSSLFDLNAFASCAFTVSPKSNRVGLRLVEPFQAHSHELPSEPAGCGAIQVTPDGGVIVLGPDGPTIGGYPKIAYVISADWDRLGQLRPSDKVHWELVSIGEARMAADQREAAVPRRLAELRILNLNR